MYSLMQATVIMWRLMRLLLREPAVTQLAQIAPTADICCNRFPIIWARIIRIHLVKIPESTIVLLQVMSLN